MRWSDWLAALLCVFLFVSVAEGAAMAPCTDAGTMGIIPLRHASATYCVSDFGWSDAWFVGGAPALYDPRLDVLSGDDAPNLHFEILGGPPGASGFGWISPIMDAGFLEPVWVVPSAWEVVTPVHYTAGTTSAESLVRHPLGLDMLITTGLDPLGQEITQTFTITNTTATTTFLDLRLADYFNFHPNGSTAGGAQMGTVTYDPLGGIRITGVDDGTLIANGSVRGERVDDAHGRNDPSFVVLPIAVLDMVQTNVYLDPGPVPIGPGDVAGALAWDLGDLGPGEVTTFSVFKLAEPLAPPPVPEPGTGSLLLAGGALLWGLRRRGA